MHITIDDQMKINKFANYNAKVEDLKEELKIRQNELKNLEEAGDEIELLDDDTQIPFLIGEVFMSHDLARTQVSFLIGIFGEPCHLNCSKFYLTIFRNC